MKPQETFELNGYTVNIIYDSDAESPSKNSDDEERRICFLTTTNNRYFVVRVDGFNPEDLEDEERLAEVEKTHHVYPLYAYIHSGVALSLGRSGQFSCPWDSGRIGSVFITKDTSEITEPEKCAEGLVEQWNQYLSGDVWGYEIEDPDGVHVDSCCGFYGLEYCKEEARNAVPDVTPVPLTTLSQSCVGAGI